MGKHYLKCLACGREEIANTTTVKYFSLPKNRERRIKWLSAIQQLNLLDEKISEDYKVCEDHFSNDMHSQCKFRLKLTAIPCLHVLYDRTKDKFDQNLYAENFQSNGSDRSKGVHNRNSLQSRNYLEEKTANHKKDSTEHQSLQTNFRETRENQADKEKANPTKQRLECQQLTIKENTLSGSKMNDVTSEQPSCSTNFEDQMRIASDNKKIECLEAVIEYTSQMQSIVKKKGGLDSLIQANSHLIRLVDEVVYEWFQRAQRRIEIGVITNELFIQIALESKQIFCIQNFDPDCEWLNRLKTKYNITDLDMRLLHIQKNSLPLSVDVHEIILHVLEKNPIAKYFSNSSLTDGAISEKESDIEMKPKIEIITQMDNDIQKNEEFILPDTDTNTDRRFAISNDNQARLHLKPLEEYVLLKDNFRAIGLISQLMDIFSAEMKN